VQAHGLRLGEAGHLQRRRYLPGHCFQQGQLAPPKRTARPARQFQRADAAIPGQQRHADIALEGGPCFGLHVVARAHIFNEQRLAVHGDPARVPFARCIDRPARFEVERDQPARLGAARAAYRAQPVALRVGQGDLRHVKGDNRFQAGQDRLRQRREIGVSCCCPADIFGDGQGAQRIELDRGGQRVAA